MLHRPAARLNVEVLETSAEFRLFPALPLYAGVLITAADSFIILLFFRASNGRHGMLLFEIVIISLVSVLHCIKYAIIVGMPLMTRSWRYLSALLYC
jgi:Mn2+/Fe2+ NRAMP family transporter